MTRVNAVFLKLIEQYRRLGYRLSLLEIHKLAYLLQSAGLDLKLEYKKHKFGPYAEEVNFVLQHMEGHYTRGYGDRSQRAEISPLSGAIHVADEYLSTDPQAAEFLNRVSRLIEGFETPYGNGTALHSPLGRYGESGSRQGCGSGHPGRPGMERAQERTLHPWPYPHCLGAPA